MDDNYQEYLKKKHAEYVTPQYKIDELVQKATDSTIKFQKRLMLGEANEVYDIKTDKEKDVILRISHGGQQYSFKAEKWALEESAKAGVPVPEVLYVEDFELDGKDCSACVLKKLLGEPLGNRIHEKRITEEELSSVLKQVGMFLAKMHTVKPKRFGHLKTPGEAECDSWYEFITRHKDKTELFKQILRGRNLDENYIPKIYEVFEEYREQLESVTPHLIHGDMGYEHIFVDGNTVTGIIDFGIAKSGEPAHDFAW